MRIPVFKLPIYENTILIHGVVFDCAVIGILEGDTVLIVRDSVVLDCAVTKRNS